MHTLMSKNVFEPTAGNVLLFLPHDYRVCKKWVCNTGHGLGIIDLRIGGWITELNVWIMEVRYGCMNWDRLGTRFPRSGMLFFLMNEGIYFGFKLAP